MKPAIPKDQRYRGSKKSNVLTYKARQSLLSQAYYYLVILGFNQRKTAETIEVSTKTINTWVKKYGWHKKIEAIKTGGEFEPIRYDESLSAFVAYVRVKKPNVYKQLQKVHQQFLNSI